MSDCPSCGSTPSGSTPTTPGWTAPSNPCEATETPAVCGSLAVDAPSCDSVKTVHVITGAPLENPCGDAASNAVTNATCGEQAVNALFDTLVNDVPVPTVGGSIPMLVADASRYWPGLTIVVGDASKYFWATVVTRDLETKLLTITRLNVAGSAAAAETIVACSPIVAAVPGSGEEFCIFSDQVGDRNTGDILLFEGDDPCEVPATLPSAAGFLRHDPETGVKAWVPLPTAEGDYNLNVDGDGAYTFTEQAAPRPQILSLEYTKAWPDHDENPPLPAASFNGNFYPYEDGGPEDVDAWIELVRPATAQIVNDEAHIWCITHYEDLIGGDTTYDTKAYCHDIYHTTFEYRVELVADVKTWVRQIYYLRKSGPSGPSSVNGQAGFYVGPLDVA